jgi:hypothetical protein
MPTHDATPRQLATALRFALRNQTRNRLAWLLLVLFVPAWYILMVGAVTHKPLTFKLFATGARLHVDGRELSLLTAGLNTLTIITGFAVFIAIRRALPLDRRLVFAGYRQSVLVTAKSLATLMIAAAVAAYASLVLLAFWQPSLGGWASVLAGFTVMAAEYGALGLLLGVLVHGDLEGFFLIIMGSLVDTSLQNPVGNPLANNPVLQYFPSFGPMQVTVGGTFAHTTLWADLVLGVAWAAAMFAAALVVFRLRTRVRTHPRTSSIPVQGPRREPTAA